MRIAPVTRIAPRRWLREAPPVQPTQAAANTPEAGAAHVGKLLPLPLCPPEREGPGRPGQEQDGSASAFDEAIFARTARALPPDVLTAFLQTVAMRGRTLAMELQGYELASDRTGHLADLAHTLGGSAGMFGFSRLAASAKRFEYAVHANVSEMTCLAAELGEAAEQAVAVVGNKLNQAA